MGLPHSIRLTIYHSNTLYPDLEDHALVQSYPNVRGMHKNIFFVSHSHKEAGGGEDAVSKYNQYEVCTFPHLPTPWHS